MATRTLSRRALRDQNDAAEAAADEPDDEGDDAPAPKVKKPRAKKATTAKEKKPAKPRVRKTATKVPLRTVARWAVCDNAMKRVAVFEYRDRTGADEKLTQIRESKAGTFFIVMVKDAYDPPAEVPAEPPAAPA